jgi:NCAIR mutase (PurE)-related protein
MAFFIGISTALTVFAVLCSSPVLAVPTPQTVGSGLSILTHNDLYGVFAS